MDCKQGYDHSQPQRRLEILIVDDDPTSAECISDLITQSCGIPANVRQATSAEDARPLLGGGQVDLCLTNFELGSIDGLTRGADGSRSGTAFVYLAEQGRRDWVYAAIRHGAQDLVRKDRLDPYEIAKTLAFALYHKGHEQELTATALRDPLTGLGNRALFNEQVKVLIEQARRNREQLAVLFMDIDGLKPVNDGLGHSVGDRLLQQVGRRISGSVRKSDVVARMGGDEFAAVLPRVASAQTVAQVVLDLTETVESKPYRIDAHTIRIGLSCGSAIFPDDDQSADALLDLADSRMYEIKARRRTAVPPAGDARMSWFGRKTPEI